MQLFIMIKVKNNRKNGSLFHYAHFLCDCLFPEIINNVFLHNQVIRKKNIHQTIGNFSKIYEEVMDTKNIELLSPEFDNLNIDILEYQTKEEYCNKIYFDIFRNFIFTKYNINSLEYNNNYPKVILIKRDTRINLIDDEYLKALNNNITTGKERREINNIDEIESFLQNKYNDSFESLFFENITFKEQILYFNNAQLIICAHGAVMSNMFFCKESTTIIEITCGRNWAFFDRLSEILNLNHIKCIENNYDNITDIIKIHGII